MEDCTYAVSENYSENASCQEELNFLCMIPTDLD